MADLSINFAGVEFKNPIVTASGTFGFGREYGEYYALSKLGGICVKGLTVTERLGNSPPRIAETPAGMLNSVGLQNPGVDAFVRDELPFLKSLDTVIIANISGNTVEEYAEMAEKLSDADGVDMLEVNVSCPNVKAGGMQFGTTTDGVSAVTAAVKKRAKLPVIVKLSPNVTDIAEIARAAEGSGADAVSLINTLLAMRIDTQTRRPVLHNNVGGLSGPAVFPVAVRMVWQAASAVKIPVLGMGGVMDGDNAAEMMLAGASLIGVGTASIADPYAPLTVIEGLDEYLTHNNIGTAREIIGGVILN
jgi:dihydroorotate dehydrogenase (NAD+) catalytic subunit